jgi:hypothetical protein
VRNLDGVAAAVHGLFGLARELLVKSVREMLSPSKALASEALANESRYRPKIPQR